MIDEFIGADCLSSAGHSEATAARIAQAADRGVTGVTHLFNAMSQLRAREPGWLAPRSMTSGYLPGSSATASMSTHPACASPCVARAAIA